MAERLRQLLATRGGSTADLVAAERALSQVQEELDQARSWLAEMKGRIAMSDIDISYSSYSSPGSGLVRPVKDALSSAGETLGESVAALLRVFIAVAPWAFVFWAMVKLYRRVGGKLPRLRLLRRKTPTESSDLNNA